VVTDIRDNLRRFADNDTIDVDMEVAKSEAATGFRNYSLAYFMRGFDNLKNPVEDTLTAYFSQCSLRITCRQLARAGLFLANRGTGPDHRRADLSPEHARRICAVMMTCGHYDASGEFAFQVGLPGKSGVGGGILPSCPARRRSAVWSPGAQRVRAPTQVAPWRWRSWRRRPAGRCSRRAPGARSPRRRSVPSPHSAGSSAAAAGRGRRLRVGDAFADLGGRADQVRAQAAVGDGVFLPLQLALQLGAGEPLLEVAKPGALGSSVVIRSTSARASASVSRTMA
jgi:hypothetical protein